MTMLLSLLSESASQLPDIPTTSAVAALVGIATWVVRSGMNRSENESREYRTLLKDAIDGMRQDFKDLSETMGASAKAQEANAEQSRAMVGEIGRLVVATQRLERMLIRAGTKPDDQSG